MHHNTRQGTRDPFLGMAPFGPHYSQGKGLGRPASNGGFTESVFRVIGHRLSGEIRIFTSDLKMVLKLPGLGSTISLGYSVHCFDNASGPGPGRIMSFV